MDASVLHEKAAGELQALRPRPLSPFKLLGSAAIPPSQRPTSRAFSKYVPPTRTQPFALPTASVPTAVPPPSAMLPPPLVPLPQHPFGQLPEVRLIEFSGDIKEWPTFWATFRQVVDSQPLADIAKLTYLLSVPKRTAGQAVAGFLPRPENYTTVVQTLKDAYEKDGILRAQLWRKINSIPSAARYSDLPSTWQRVETMLR